MKKNEEYNDIHSFLRDFGTNEQCYEHLYSLKWSAGYACKKCGHDVSVKGRKWHYRKCQKCKYDESSTAHTLFHEIKFPLHKAFLMLHQITTLKKGLSALDMSRQHAVHQNTTWHFKRKVQEAMTTKGRVELLTSVEVDETAIGGAEKGKPGRSHGKKGKVVVALEVDYPEHGDKPTIKNASAEVIDDYSSEELSDAIDEMVDSEAVITTDGWSAYKKAVGERIHIRLLSSNLSNFVDLHWYIFNLKNWLRTIHQGVSIKHLTRYLNEFNFRFNNRNYSGDGFLRVIKYMVKSPKLTRQMATGE
jgi:transposase-like protein